MKLEEIPDEELLDAFSRFASHDHMLRHVHPYGGNNAQRYLLLRTELLQRLLSRGAFIKRFCKLIDSPKHGVICTAQLEKLYNEASSLLKGTERCV